MSENNEPGALENAEQIIERFGGIRPMATKMQVPVTTVQGWKKRNVIPENRREDVIRAAQTNDIDISDLVEKGAANENASRQNAAERTASFASEIKAITEDRTATYELRPEQVIKPAAPSSPSSAPAAQIAAEKTPHGLSPEAIIIRIADAERRAVRKSVLMSTLLIAALGGLGALLLWPVGSQVSGLNSRLAAVETQTAGIDRRVGLLEQGKTLVAAALPPDVAEKIGTLQDQVVQLGKQIQAASGASLAGVDTSALEQRVAALESKIGEAAGGGLSALASKLQALQQSQQGQQQLMGAVKDLAALVTGSQGNVDAALAQAGQASGALGETFKGLSAGDLKPAAMMMGLADLRGSLAVNAPFDTELQLMQALLGDAADPALRDLIQQLAPVAKQGVLTPAGLQDQFKGLADAIVAASLKGGDVTLKDKAMAQLGGLVEVQKDGKLISGTDTQAKIAQAQQSLANGDIAGAIAALQGLDGGAAEAAKSFVDNAQSTLLAQKVQDQMTAAVTGLLGQGAPLTK